MNKETAVALEASIGHWKENLVEAERNGWMQSLSLGLRIAPCAPCSTRTTV